MTYTRICFAVWLAFLWTSTSHAFLILECLGVDADPQLRQSQLYGYARPYSAEVQVIIRCPTNCPSRTSVIGCAASAGWLRTDVDLTKTTAVDGKTAADLLGVDHSILIWRPDRNMSYRIFPSRKGYFEEPGLIKPDEKYAPPGPLPTLSNKLLGEEVVDNHLCRKYLRTFVPAKGARQYEITVWEAKDLGNFCIQMQYADEPLFCERCVITMLFKQISFKPDPSLFEVPKGYRKYEDPLKLLERRACRRNDDLSCGCEPEVPLR